MNRDVASSTMPPFPDGYRASGLLLHFSSLPSPYGIGDVGPSAVAWIDKLSEAGQSWWQALPLGPTGYGNSPYQSLSSFAGNGLLISPDWLIEEGLLQESECAAPSFPSAAVDYDAVIAFKRRLLQTAWGNFQTSARSEMRTAFEQFCHEQAHWLEDYALFRVLKAKYGEAYYLEWPAELVRRDPAALARVRRKLGNEIQQACFAQFVLFRQGERLREYGRSKGVSLNLGIITPDVSKLRDEFHIPGTRVLQFAFDGHADNPYLPENFVPNTVVYTGTHDNPTTRQWYDALPESERRALWDRLKSPRREDAKISWEMMRTAWSSIAALAIAPLQDLLNLGSEARMNVPGRASGNWTWRCTHEMLSGCEFEWLYDLTRMTNRLDRLRAPLSGGMEASS